MEQEAVEYGEEQISHAEPMLVKHLKLCSARRKPLEASVPRVRDWE